MFRFPGRGDEPLVVLVLVVVASDLLLLGADGVGLDVRVEKSSAVAHVLEREARAEGGFCKASKSAGGQKRERDGRRTERVASKIVPFEVSLEEGAHLRVAGSRLVEDNEVELEA